MAGSGWASGNGPARALVANAPTNRTMVESFIVALTSCDEVSDEEGTAGRKVVGSVPVEALLLVLLLS